VPPSISMEESPESSLSAGAEPETDPLSSLGLSSPFYSSISFKPSFFSGVVNFVFAKPSPTY